MDDLPDDDVIMTPFGGGGLSIGVASAVKAVRPDVRVVACEVAIAAPLGYSRRMGAPSVVPDHVPSFVDGMGEYTYCLPFTAFAPQGSLVPSQVKQMTYTIDTCRFLAKRSALLG